MDAVGIIVGLVVIAFTVLAIWLTNRFAYDHPIIRHVSVKEPPKGTPVSPSRLMLKTTNWADYHASHGRPGAAVNVGEAIRDLLDADDNDDYWKHWRRLEGSVFCQSEVFSVAEPVMRTLTTALAEDISQKTRDLALDLIPFVVNGSPSDAPLGDPQLVERCRAIVREALDLIVRDHLRGNTSASGVLSCICDEVEIDRINKLSALAGVAALPA